MAQKIALRGERWAREGALRVGTSFSSAEWTALQGVERSFLLLGQASLRMATQLRVNAAADDPAASFAIADLQGMLVELEADGRAAAHAAAATSVADNGALRIGNLLDQVRGQVVSAASDGASPAERAAWQQAVDGALEAIDRIAAGTQVGGQRLLDGSTAALQYALSTSGGSARLDLPDLTRQGLGDGDESLAELASGGLANLATGNLTRALDLLDAARATVGDFRAQAGAFARDASGATRQLLDAQQIATTAALSDVRDVDFADAASQLLRAELLGRSSLMAFGASLRRRTLLLDLLEEI